MGGISDSDGSGTDYTAMVAFVVLSHVAMMVFLFTEMT
jgi:hypothetical protein